MLTFRGPNVEVVARVALAAADEENRYGLRGVYVSPSAFRAGRYDVVATTGKILAHACLEPEPGSSLTVPSRGALLPPELLRELGRHYRWWVRKGEGGWKSPPGCPVLEIDVISEVGDGAVSLQVNGARAEFRLMSEAYPDYPIVLKPYLKGSLTPTLKLGAWLNPHYLLLAAKILGLPYDATITSHLVGQDAESPQVGLRDGILVLVLPLVQDKKSAGFAPPVAEIREHLGASRPEPATVAA